MAHMLAAVSALVGSLLLPSIAAAGDDRGSSSATEPSTGVESPTASEPPALPRQAHSEGTSVGPTASEEQETPDIPEGSAAPKPPAAARAARQVESESHLAAEPSLDGDDSRLPSEKPREWYGLPMILLDGVWIGVIGLGRAAHSDKTVILGAVGGITNGLFVHVYTYDSSFAGLGVGLISVALRGALAGGGCSLGSGCNELSDGALLRTSIGLAIGAGLDAALLAYKPLFRPRPTTGIGFAPLLSPSTVGGTVAGRF